MHAAQSDLEEQVSRPEPSGGGARAARAVPQVAAVLVVALLLAVIVRLPWIGDLGMHAATIQRLGHSLLHPGNPLVDADTPSPYYSPWMLLLGALAKVSGLSVFVVLRIGALVGLTLLVTGVWRYVRTLSAHRAAPALALLGLVLLWGTAVLNWSGFIGLHSLALTISYPSVFALGLTFHFWAWLTRSLRARASWGRWLALGVLWALILLCHQFTGVVATLGALAMVVSARPGRDVWLRLGGGLALGAVLLGLWPYYDFFSLFSAGADLEAIHKSLYQHLFARFGLVLLGVAALVPRLRRDRWDALALFFVLGVLVVAAGGLTGHYSWGRALPAALIPAQLAAALEVVSAGRRAARAGWACVLGLALAVGAWAQAGTLGYVTGKDALPSVLAARYEAPWAGYHWITPWVRYGDVVMARTFPARQIPAYGGYTVAPGYPDVFLRDSARRSAAVDRFFADGTSAAERRRILREYGVRWVVGSADLAGPGLRKVATGPGHQVLYRVGP
ncbi:hypothetical protein ACL07V_19910 [Streptomyces sp. MB22_4]|uniref:hypothetical protein n=1 Tax=Streptomyces sp. MB22_4 TaxID=3383120 RepID=UPI0039A39D2E